MIAASSSAGTAAAKADPRDAGADTSPFALLLAATLQDTPSAQPQVAAAPPATDTGTPAAPPAATPATSDPGLDPAEVTPPPLTTTDDKVAVAQGSGKHDKKADSGKSKDDDASASDQQALQTAQNLSLAATIPPVVQAAVQTASQPSQASSSVNDSDDGVDLTNAISAATASSVKNADSPAKPVQAGSGNPVGAKSVAGKTAAPQTPSQPPVAANDDAEPVTPAPVAAQAAIATDDSDSDSDNLDTVSSKFAVTAKTRDAAAQPSTTASVGSQPVDASVTVKAPAGNRAAASPSTTAPAAAPAVAAKPAAPQPPAQTAANDDADPATQTPAAPPANQTAQIAVNAATDSDQDTDISADAAQASAQMPDVRNSAPSNRTADKPTTKPVQSAANVSSPSPAPAAQNAPAASDVDGKDTGTDKNSAPTQASSDSKSPHVVTADATPQPVPPAPVVHAATPANPAPQNMTVADIGGANPPAGTGNTAPAVSVHLANAGTDPTPDTNALAVSVAARSLSGARQFDIRLDPPELGHVEVRLSIDASGKTQAHMTADQPQTLALLQKDAPTLTQALRDAGLDVSQGGLNFSLRGQDRQSGERNNGAGQGRRTNLTATRSIGAAQGPMPVSYNGAAADARVDIHV